MQGGFTLLYLLTCAVTLFVKVTVQEFPFLHVFVSCFVSSLGFGAASHLRLMSAMLKLLHRFL